MAPLFLWCLGRHSKEAGDEGDLPGDVSFAHPSDLTLPEHVHARVPLQRSLCCFHGKEAHPRFDPSFDEGVVLLDQGIQVFDLPQLPAFSQQPGGFEFSNGFRIRRIFIDVDHTRAQPPASRWDALEKLNQPWSAVQGIVADFEVRAASFVELGSRVLHPTGDRAMLN